MRFDFHPTGQRVKIPDAFADQLEKVYDRRPTTVWEWWTLEADRSEEAKELEASDFYTAERTRHEVQVDNGGGYTPCVLDALNVAAMEEGRALVCSTDPITGTIVRAEFDTRGVDVDPREAVISIGQNPEPDFDMASCDSIIDLSRETDRDVFRENFCTYGNAFESEDTYEVWAARSEGISFPALVERIATLLNRLHRSS